MTSHCWVATGSFDVKQFKEGDEVVPTIPLKKVKDLPYAKPVCPEVTLPDGTKKQGTVDPGDITPSFSDFPFPKFVVVGTQCGLVQMQATHDFGDTVDILANDEAKIKVEGQAKVSVKLQINWGCLTAAGKVDQGATYEAAVPLQPDGDSSSKGLAKPVTVQLQLPNGDVVAETTVEPRHVTPGGFKDVLLPKFVAPASGELVLKVTTQETGNSPFPLRVGDVKMKKSAA